MRFALLAPSAAGAVQGVERPDRGDVHQAGLGAAAAADAAQQAEGVRLVLAFAEEAVALAPARVLRKS